MVACYVDSSILISALTPTESRRRESVKTLLKRYRVSLNVTYLLTEITI